MSRRPQLLRRVLRALGLATAGRQPARFKDQEMSVRELFAPRSTALVDL
jgi:hypothetical protein